METVVIPKAWWTSKTFQGLAAAAVASVYRILAKKFHWPDWSSEDADLVAQLLQVAGFVWAGIGLRTAVKPIGNPAQSIVVPSVTGGTASGEAPAKGGLE